MITEVQELITTHYSDLSGDTQFPVEAHEIGERTMHITAFEEAGYYLCCAKREEYNQAYEKACALGYRHGLDQVQIEELMERTRVWWKAYLH